MSTDLEQRLRDDMGQFTEDLKLPAGFAARVYRHGRKRQQSARVLVAGGLAIVLAGAAAAVAAVIGGTRPANGQRIQTAAYVIPEVRHALATAEWNNTIVYVRMGHSVPMTWQPLPGMLTGYGSTRSGAAPGTASYETSITYQGRWKFSAVGQDGQRLFSELVATGKGSQTTAAVLYSSGTWWRVTRPPIPQPPKTTGCVTNGDFRAWDGPSGDWPDLIRAELSCGAFKLAGTEVTDGVNAIKITGSFGASTLTLWVDPGTFLPVKVARTLDGQPSAWQDFKWLTPTAANRALLNLPVPAGFKRVAPPA